MSITQEDWQHMRRPRRRMVEPLYQVHRQAEVAPLPPSLRGEPVGARRWAEIAQRRLDDDAVPLWQPVLLIGLALLSLLIFGVSLTANTAIVRSLRAPFAVETTLRVDAAAAGAPAALPPAGDHRLRAAPSLTAEQIDRVLAQYGSPATGSGALWYRLGVERGIDPAYALAFFIHESGAGTSPAWAGLKPDGATTHNVGNIICAGYQTCFGRFRDYPDWAAGIADWYRLIDVEYLQWRGLSTVAEIIPVYAPSIENNVERYIATVEALVDAWRRDGVR